MKKALFTLLMAAVPVCMNAQIRIFEPTIISWERPNLSVETFKDLVFTAYTDHNPNTGLSTPVLKVTDINGVSIPGWFNYLDLGADVNLMDFTVRPSQEHLFFTGYEWNFPYRMFILETDFAGNFVQLCWHGLANGNGYIPHQIIYSEGAQQTVVVGTEVNAPLAASNTYTVGKTGYVMAVDANNVCNVAFLVESETPTSVSDDADMLETVTEMPSGYFIGGSANFTSWWSNTQELFTMGVDYAGTVLYSNIWSNTNYHHAGSSVLYSPNTNTVVVMSNNSVIHQFMVGHFDWTTGQPLNPASPFNCHMTSSLPISSGIDQNGFRLQETAHGEFVIGGYYGTWWPSATTLPSMITPFQVTLDASLTNMLFFKYYQSENNYNSGDYFSMMGNSVYINTPDMIVYNRDFDRTFLVNHNTNRKGFDLHVSSPYDHFKCETPVPSNWFDRVTPDQGPAAHPWPPYYTGSGWEQPMQRGTKAERICAKSLTAEADGKVDATLFPNPATEFLTIESNDVLRSIRMIDLNGTVVQVIDVEAADMEWTLSVKDLKAGVYFVEMENEDGILTRERFVKE
jgi:hypothetical protein